MTDLNELNANMALTPIHRAVGIVCDEVGEGHAVTHIPDGEFVRSGHAPIHGGVIGLLADVTSAMSLDGMYDMGVSIPVSVDLSVRFFSQPKAWPVTAEATIVHKGSKIVGTECVVCDANGRQIARTTATYMIVEGFQSVANYKGG